MNPDAIAPMVVFVTLILTTGGVLILRPITKRLGALLEVMTQEKLRARNSSPEMGQVRELLQGIDSRLSQLEERQDFAEALISSGEMRRELAPRPPANTH